MDVKEIYKKSYEEFVESGAVRSKKEWLSSEVFGFATYDPELDRLFTKKIIEVCKAILNKTTFEYIWEDEQNYITYITVCQLFVHCDWIDWGTSIRGAWFCAGKDAKPILTYYYDDEVQWLTIPFSVEYLKALIEFVEE